MNDTKNFMKEAVSSDDASPRTLVHEIMQSKLPPEEKTFERVFEEVSTTTGAGFETTATVIRTALSYIYTKHDILQNSRAELTAAPERGLEALEQLPYLSATIMEAMRLAPAIATRSACIFQGPRLRWVEDTGRYTRRHDRVPASPGRGRVPGAHALQPGPLDGSQPLAAGQDLFAFLKRKTKLYRDV
jgi:hypothetical protein